MIEIRAAAECSYPEGKPRHTVLAGDGGVQRLLGTSNYA